MDDHNTAVTSAVTPKLMHNYAKLFLALQIYQTSPACHDLTLLLFVTRYNNYVFQSYTIYHVVIYTLDFLYNAS